MKKSTLIAQMNEVIAKNNQLFERCQVLERSIKERDELIVTLTQMQSKVNDELLELKKVMAAKNNEVSSFEAGGEVLTAENTTEAIFDEEKVNITNTEIDVSDEEQNEVEDIYSEPTVVEIVVKNNEPEAECSKNYTALISEDKLNIASESIGRIVLKSAELCNTFAQNGDINAKDLINLALGRTEVFKSEVLQLVSEDMSIERLSAEVNSREAAVVEYFDLLVNQI